MKPSIPEAIAHARKKIKVEPGLKILVTPEIVEYWRKKLKTSPFPALAVVWVMERSGKDWLVKPPDGSQMVLLSDHMVRAGAVAHQVMQLGQTAEKFFRAVALASGGMYLGMERMKAQGWVGRMLMTPDTEKPGQRVYIPEISSYHYPWEYSSVLPDSALQDDPEVVPSKLVEAYAVQLVLQYHKNQRYEQPKERLQ